MTWWTLSLTGIFSEDTKQKMDILRDACLSERGRNASFNSLRLVLLVTLSLSRHLTFQARTVAL